MSEDQSTATISKKPGNKKTKDFSALLPILGILLFVTPLISLIPSTGETAQLPRSAVYVFGAWFLLIVLAFLLSKALRKADELD
jgi:hypothetical protein